MNQSKLWKKYRATLSAASNQSTNSSKTRPKPSRKPRKTRKRKLNSSQAQSKGERRRLKSKPTSSTCHVRHTRMSPTAMRALVIAQIQRMLQLNLLLMLKTQKSTLPPPSRKVMLLATTSIFIITITIKCTISLTNIRRMHHSSLSFHIHTRPVAPPAKLVNPSVHTNTTWPAWLPPNIQHKLNNFIDNRLSLPPHLMDWQWQRRLAVSIVRKATI